MRFLWPLCIVLACLCPACNPAESPVVASIGAQRISAAVLRAAVEEISAAQSVEYAENELFPGEPTTDKYQYLQPLIDRSLLLLAARDRGLHSAQTASDDSLIAVLQKKISTTRVLLSAAELRQYYNDHPEQFYDEAAEEIQPYAQAVITVRARAERQEADAELQRLLTGLRAQRAAEIEVFPRQLNLALSDTLVEQKNVQRGALLSRRGGVFLKQGRLRKALAILSRAAVYAPELAQTHLYTGLAHARLEHNEQALYSFERAIALDPDLLDLYYVLGRALQMLNRPAEAVTRFEQAIERKADQPHYHFHLGEAHRALANFDRALVAYRAAVALDPGYVEARYRQSDLLGRNGDLDGAAAGFASVLAMEPKYAAALIDLARIYGKQQRHVEAVSALEKALGLDPTNHTVYNLLGQAQARAGRRDRADVTLAAFERLSAAERHYAQGIRNAQQRYWDRAAALLNRAIEIDSSHVQARIRLAMVHLYCNAPAKGILALEQAVALDPDNVEAHCLLGEAYSSTGRPDSARYFFTLALGLDSTSVRAQHGWAKAAFQAGDSAAAVAGFHLALAINPDHAESHYLLATAFMRLRQFGRAARSFQSCLEIDPGHIEARYGQGLLLRHYGAVDRARGIFAEMLKRDPDHVKAQQQLLQLERER